MMKTQASSVIVQWFNYLNSGTSYMSTVPASNYGAGYYGLMTATSIALQGRDATNGPLVKTALQNFHDTHVLPLFQAPSDGTGTNQGGFWSEGWNYGQESVQGIISADLAYEIAGFGSATPDRTWANDVITALLTEQSTLTSIYDGGDGYSYPEPFPQNEMISDLAYAASDANAKGYANWVLQNYGNMFGVNLDYSGYYPDWEDLIFRDPNATAIDWKSASNATPLPLAYLSPGTGLVVARKDWTYASTWFSFLSGNVTGAAHQAMNQGAIELDRGPDKLLVNYAAVTEDQTFQDKSKYGNLLVIDDNGAGEQTYPFSQGSWYGNVAGKVFPSVVMNHFEGSDTFAYTQGNYAAAYGSNTGASNPATELVRSVFYVRSDDHLVVYDRATTTHPTYTKQLRWHFLNAPQVSGSSWSVTQGGSKLFAQTYSDLPLTTTVQTVTYETLSVQEVSTNNASPVASVQYVTAMQVGAATLTSMDPASHIESTDHQLEGAIVSSDVVLFAKAGKASGAITYVIPTTSGKLYMHYVTDLTPDATYTLTGATTTTSKADAQGVATFASMATGSSQTIGLQ
jgi:hypothetical protein